MKKHKKYQGLSLIDFQEGFGTEKACREHLIGKRWPEGYVCKCGSKRSAYKPSRREFQCYDCHAVCSVTAGTVMHRSKVPLRKWFWCIFLLATSKKAVSTLYLSEQLKVSYPTAWAMRRKLQLAMAHRDEVWSLSGTISADEFFLGGKQSNKQRVENPKEAFFIALQEDSAGRPTFAKAEQIESAYLNQSLEPVIAKHLEQAQTLKSDGKGAYQNVAYEQRVTHERVVAQDQPDLAHQHLEWVNIIISNLKRYLLSTHHGVFKGHQKHYIAEFLYRLNRRFFKDELFDRLTFASVFMGPTPLRAA